MRKKLIILLGVMTIVLAAVFTIASYTKRNDKAAYEKNENSIQVVTSFYPTYILAINLMDGISEVKVDSLTDFNSGCLHDYQLSTGDMRLLSNADIFMINGGGMEEYLDEVISSYPHLRIINLSEGIDMLDSEVHEGGDNPHVWLDPELYMLQIDNARDGLEKYIVEILDSENYNIEYKDESNKSYSIEHKEESSKNYSIEDKEESSKNYSIEYKEETNKNYSKKVIERLNTNTSDYLESVGKLADDMNLILQSVNNMLLEKSISNKVVVFHDSFAYLSNKAGLEVAHTIEIDEDTALSASQVAEVISTIRNEGISYLFTEEQYDDTISDRIKEETDARVYIIDSAVTGDANKDSYIKAMRRNIETLKQAFEMP